MSLTKTIKKITIKNKMRVTTKEGRKERDKREDHKENRKKV